MLRNWNFRKILKYSEVIEKAIVVQFINQFWSFYLIHIFNFIFFYILSFFNILFIKIILQIKLNILDLEEIKWYENI